MKRLKVWTVLALVFAAGFAGGVLATRVLTRHVVRAAIGNPGLIQGQIERQLDRRLRLDNAQSAEVRRILRQSQERLEALRGEFQPRFRAILEEGRRDISDLLTPEQARRFEEYLADRPLPSPSGTQGPLPE